MKRINNVYLKLTQYKVLKPFERCKHKFTHKVHEVGLIQHLPRPQTKQRQLELFRAGDHEEAQHLHLNIVVFNLLKTRFEKWK